MSDVEADITQALESVARSQPAAPAIHVPGRMSLTYADLWRQIPYVRERLASWGIKRGDVIAGVIPLRPEMAVACATVHAGATFAPLSPGFKSDAYSELLERLKPKALLVPADFDHPVRLAARRCGLAEIELVPDPCAPAGTFKLELTRRQASLTRAASSRPDWAYLLTTSGTTERPKLVPISHRQVVVNAQSLGDRLRLTPRDVGCHLVPMHHVHGLETVLMIPLQRGASVVCLPESDIDGFFAALDTYQITCLMAVVTVLREILRRAPEFPQAVAGHKLRFMRAAAGWLAPDEIDRIEKTFGVPLLTGFGMTEARMITNDPLPPRTRKRGSVGVPLCSQVAIMTDAGAICATGGVGEIVVRGPPVFDGYFDDAEATAAAFIDGWFRTGDLGRFDGDGYLYLAGRIKEFINRGGEKISPAEIDAAIADVPGVREAATFAIPHSSLGEEVVAAVIRDGNVTIAASDIIDQVRLRLGPTQGPRKIYFVDQLPRTDSGKVRRSELPRLLGLDQAATASAGDTATEAPAQTLLETTLVGLWSLILQAGSVGVNDDFFLLGGDSLSGARLLTSVNAVLGVNLPIVSLFREAATIAGMARAIEAARSSGPAEDSCADGPRGTRLPTSIMPLQARRESYLSDAQRRMWFLARLDPRDATYNESRAYRLIGEIDIEALRRSVRYVAMRHKILRTSYSLIDDEPRQIVRADLAIDLKCVDLGAVPRPQQSDAIHTLLLDEMRRPFDLEADTPLRMLLARLGERNHVLLRVIHHIACDDWSSGIFERELSAAYAAFVEGKEPQLPALPIQYADFAAWQREWLRDEALGSRLAYWKTRLAGIGALALPGDRARPPVASHQGAYLPFDLPALLTGKLKALGRSEGATLFMTLLAAFQVLLYRYSGQHDIAVGSPIAGRGRAELEGLIGFFVNTLVLRTDMSGNPRFRELLVRVRENALGAYTHQDLPFEKLVEALAPARDLSRNPLFQVMFVLQNAPSAALTLAGIETIRMPLEARNAKFDLTVSVRESAEGLHASWEYASDLFEAATIERMARHFERLLEAIVADPGQRIDELPLLAEAERHLLLVEWNDTAADYPKDRCIHQLFEEQAARTPDAVAVVFEERQLTYAELNARANRLARQLVALGLGPEALVGICVERSFELIVGLLGILKSGGAYVPLDPGYPKERLAFMLKDTQAPVLLTQQRLLQRLPHYEGRILCLDRDWDIIAAQPNTVPLCHVRAENLAYVIYTSGSTGTPKGVMIEHRALLNYVLWLQRKFPFAHGDRVLQSTSASFDISILELFAPFLGGAQIIMAAPGIQRSPPDLIEAVKRRQVTVLDVVPSMLTAMLDEPGLSQCTALRRLFCGGEALLPEVVRRFRARLNIEFINLYGPTEATIDATYYVCPPESHQQTIPIGRPLSNTRIYILGGAGEPVPIGVMGELHIAGAGLARGYLNRPEMTAEKFLPDPFSTVPGARMYRTGDLVRYLPDGNVEFLGRIDNQVKIRGFRIELGEIESLLAEHPAVRQAVVLAREDTPGDKRLVAYVVPADASLAHRGPLRALLQERLPEYMLPSAYMLLDRLPLMPNGKVDRRALPEIDYARSLKASYVPPCTVWERKLADVWQKVLRVKQVGVDDNFFDLGGHSLMIVQLIHEINRTHKVSLNVSEVFQNPSVGQMAKLFDDQQSNSKRQPAVVQLRKGRARVPVYFIHAGPDEFRLAQWMGGSHSVFGIEAPWPLAWRSAVAENRNSAFPSMEQLVARYVAVLSDHARTSPCVLAGHSFAGLIAFEAAHQFRKQGGKVEMVLLFDTWARIPGPFQVAWHNLRDCWRTASGRSPAEQRSTSIGTRLKRSWLVTRWLLGQEKRGLRSFFRRLALNPSLTTLLDEQGVPLPGELIGRLYKRLQDSHIPRCLDCSGVLFRADSIVELVATRKFDESMGWKNLFARGLEIVPTTGNHLSIIREHSSILAQKLDQVLERQQQRKNV